MFKLKAVLAVFVLLGFFGFYINHAANAESVSKNSVNSSAYTKISPQQAKFIMDNDAYDCIIIDVRSLEEYTSGHIQNAVSLPNELIQAESPQINAVLPDKEQAVLVYCRSGKRSKQASDKLVALGYTHIYDIGGIIDWPYEVVK
ncbi:MAG TPA: rhodanese-like domain-containing protein [Candidatus Megamonas gallistercoris]|nr:rhodanese-like domain-containing protein [Candidatus Megamonas gallistercoris]